MAPRTDRPFLRKFVDDLVYVLLGFPVAVASFAALVALLSTSVSLLFIIVGVPLLIVTLYVARGCASVQRRLLELRGDDPSPAIYADSTPGASWPRWFFDRLRDRQYWLDVLHGIVVFPVATVTFSIAVSWLSATVGGLTAYLWLPSVPTDTDGTTLVEVLDFDRGGVLADLFHWTPSEEALYTAIGLVGLLTIIPVVRMIAVPQAGLSRILLANDRVAELQAKVERLRARQALAAETAVSDRQRLERDIHDGPQQRLVRLGMDLAAAERRLDQDPTAAKELLAEARGHANAALEELRLLSRGIAPPLLSDRGLHAALSDLGHRSTFPVSVDVQLPAGERLPSRVESAVYFTAAEALTNVAKHADATAAWIHVEQTSGRAPVVRLTVVDDGQGGADPTKGHGLVGLRDRVELLDGTLSITSPPGGPTRLVAEVPCAS